MGEMDDDDEVLGRIGLMPSSRSAASRAVTAEDAQQGVCFRALVPEDGGPSLSAIKPGMDAVGWGHMVPAPAPVVMKTKREQIEAWATAPDQAGVDKVRLILKHIAAIPEGYAAFSQHAQAEVGYLFFRGETNPLLYSSTDSISVRVRELLEG